MAVARMQAHVGFTVGQGQDPSISAVFERLDPVDAAKAQETEHLLGIEWRPEGEVELRGDGRTGFRRRLVHARYSIIRVDLS